MNKYKNIPDIMKEQRKWVGFKLIYKEGQAKPVKLPICPHSGKGASSVSAEDWGSFDEAVVACKKYMCSGVGYVFDGDGVVGIDIDGCVSENGEFNDVAKEIMAMTGSYTEYSPSKHGIHIYVKGSLDKAVKHSESGVELYSTGRYFTVTGDRIGECSEVLDGQDVINFITAKYGKKPNKKAVSKAKNVALSNIQLSDDEVIQLASKAKNGSDFTALYNGAWKDKYSSQSEADLSFCNLLAFWCGKNMSQMDNIFRSSGLMRDKWDEMRGADTYGDKTIAEAVANCREVYTSKTAKHKTNRKNQPTAVFESNNCYVKCSSNGATKEISNFVLKPIESIVTSDGGLLVARIINKSGKEMIRQFQMKDFSSTQAFKKVLNIASIDFSFKGTESDIELIKELISAEEFPQKQGYSGFGIHWGDNTKSEESVYVGETYTIDKNSMVHGNIVTIPKSQGVKSSIELNDEATRYEIEQVGKLLMSYNELPKTVTVLCWCAGCFAKAKLWDKGVKFPALILIGEQGSGKSTTFEKVIAPLFTMSGSVGASRISPFSLLQTAGSSNCIPYVIDEYKPSTMDKSKVDLINNFLRDSYDCHTATKGNIDMSVTTYPLLTPVCLIGEESPSESSIAERKIELMFSKTDIEDKKDIAPKLDIYKERIAIFGKALLLTALKEKTSQLKDIHDKCTAMMNAKYEERIKKNVAVCMVGLYLLDKLCKEYGATIDGVFGMSKDEMKRNIILAIESYTLDGGTYNKTIVDKTFEVFDRMTGAIRHNEHYKPVHNGEHIAFDIKSIYDLYTRYYREYSLQSELVSYDVFRKQLKKKNYYVGYEGTYMCGKTKKCDIIDVYTLSQCADVSNIIAECGISLTKQMGVFG